ncbi:MAG: NAD(P)/FAD-dependent oxidoreductase [Candidatus Methanodesulfokora sp.]
MLSLRREELPSEWDVVVIGGGPAGITSSIYLARYGLKVLMVERSSIGGKVSVNPIIENFPGFPSITGEELSRMFHEHARKSGVKILFPDEIVEMDLDGDEKKLMTKSGRKLSAKAVIIATGAEEKKLNVPGEAELYGRGVSYCAVCDGPLFRDKRVVVVGGGNTAAVSALYLAKIAKEVIVVHRRGKMRAEQALTERLESLPNVSFRWNSYITEIIGKERVEGVRIKGEKEEVIQADGIFIFVGVKPNSDVARRAGVSTDENGFILVDYWQRTNKYAVYAAGDITGEPMQIAKAVGEGVKAAVDAYNRVFGGLMGARSNLGIQFRADLMKYDKPRP